MHTVQIFLLVQLQVQAKHECKGHNFMERKNQLFCIWVLNIAPHLIFQLNYSESWTHQKNEVWELLPPMWLRTLKLFGPGLT